MKMMNTYIYKKYRRYNLLLTGIRILILALLLYGCRDDRQVPDAPETGEAQTVLLRISTPEGYPATRAEALSDRTVNTVDVLVMTGPDADDYVLAVAKGESVAGTTNRFEVTLPIGTGLDIHVFVNCRTQLENLGFFQSLNKKRDFILPWLTLANTGVETFVPSAMGDNVPINGLPMYGVMKDQDISKDMAGSALTANVLRSVAGSRIMLNVKGDETNGYTGQALPEFELRECYVYFQSLHGRLVPKDVAGFDGTSSGQVTAVSLPDENLSTVWQNGVWASEERADLIEVANLPASSVGNGFPDQCYKVSSVVPVYALAPLYLFENKAYTPDGNDSKGSVSGNDKVATTRLVVGGVYKGSDPSNTKLTYYRLNFLRTPSDKNSCHDLLRNHQYIFNIKSVSGPGYESPNAAATGIPVDIDVSVIDWVSGKTDVDFDSQNYFSAESKRVTLPRKANVTKTVTVETDVAAADWKMSFDKTTWVSGDALEGTWFNVIRETISENGKDKKYVLKFTSKQVYDTSVPHTAMLYIQAKNLTISIAIGQSDTMPDDWGNGGNEDTELGRIN